MHHLYVNYLQLSNFDNDSYAGARDVSRLEFEIPNGKIQDLNALYGYDKAKLYLSNGFRTMCRVHLTFLNQSDVFCSVKTQEEVHSRKQKWYGRKTLTRFPQLLMPLLFVRWKTFQDAAHNDLDELHYFDSSKSPL